MQFDQDFMLDYTQNLQQFDFEPIEQQSVKQSSNQNQDDFELKQSKIQTQSNTKKWNILEQIEFYKFFARTLYFNLTMYRQNDHYWNKKGLHGELQKIIKTKTVIQIKSKFLNFKRYVKNNSKMNNFNEAMKIMLYRKLCQHMDDDDECRQIIQKIDRRSDVLKELNDLIQQETEQNLKINANLRLIFSQFIKDSQQKLKKLQRLREQKRNWYKRNKQANKNKKQFNQKADYSQKLVNSQKNQNIQNSKNGGTNGRNKSKKVKKNSRKINSDKIINDK